MRLTESSSARVSRVDHSGVRAGGGVLLGVGVLSIAGELGVMIPALQHAEGWDGVGLMFATLGWSVISAALSIAGVVLLARGDGVELDTEPTVVPWGVATEDGAVLGLAGTF